MHRIRNFGDLATSPARTDALDIIEAVYAAIDTDAALRARIRVEGDTLFVVDQTFALSAYEHIYIVGCGKVACQAAATLEGIVRDKIKDGAVVGISPHVCGIVTTYQGTHPLPSGANIAASEHIINIGKEVTERDLVFAIVGGGGSALLCSSQEECDQSAELYTAFLETGGTIDELNIVRRHLSTLKGGGLAKALYPATVIGLIFSDVVGGDVRTVASGPTYKDDSTIEDARAIIEKYKLGAFSLVETPKEEKYFENVNNILIVSNDVALRAMEEKARLLGYEPLTAACDPYAAPQEMLRALEERARPGSVVLLGGEPRLAVARGEGGSGGRNSYTAAAALDVLTENQVFASFASDGCDNGSAAGAIVDLGTRRALEAAGTDVSAYRARYDTNTLLAGANALIMTGPVEANVSDVLLLLTPRV